MAERKEELTSLLMKVKEESEKAGLKLKFKKWKSWHPGPTLHGKWWENNGNSDRPYFLGFQNHCREWLQPENQKTLAPWKKSYDKQHIKKQRHYFADKGPYSQSYGFHSSHVWVWELNHKDGWVPKNWWFQTVVLEMTLENPLDSREIQAVSPKGKQIQLDLLSIWGNVRNESWTVKKAEHRRIDALNCGIGEDAWESLRLQGDQTSQS